MHSLECITQLKDWAPKAPSCRGSGGTELEAATPGGGRFICSPCSVAVAAAADPTGSSSKAESLPTSARICTARSHELPRSPLALLCLLEEYHPDFFTQAPSLPGALTSHLCRQNPSSSGGRQDAAACATLCSSCTALLPSSERLEMPADIPNRGFGVGELCPGPGRSQGQHPCAQGHVSHVQSLLRLLLLNGKLSPPSPSHFHTLFQHKIYLHADLLRFFFLISY